MFFLKAKILMGYEFGKIQKNIFPENDEKKVIKFKLPGELMNNFISNIIYALAATVDDGTIDDIGKLFQNGKSKLVGITLAKKRNSAITESSSVLMLQPNGFDLGDLKEMMRKKCSKITRSTMPAITCVS